MEYEFRINYIDSLVEVGDLSDVATKIGWTYYARQDGNVVNYIEAETVLGQADPSNFIPMDNVTLDQMITWVKTSVDEEQLKSRLNK